MVHLLCVVCSFPLPWNCGNSCLFYHWWARGHFQFRSNINNVAVNILVCIFRWANVHSGVARIPRSRLFESWGGHCQCPQMAVPTYSPTNSVWRVPVAPWLPKVGIVNTSLIHFQHFWWMCFIVIFLLFFIVVKHTYVIFRFTIFDHFIVYSSSALRTFMLLCNHHHYSTPELPSFYRLALCTR